jgi:eukaryotic translation initiation factor 2C
MIMGADVGHPGPGVQKPSVTSVVYSHDEFATQYVAVTGIQPPRIEQILDLKKYVMNALDSFGAKNKIPPRKLIFFRDGLSEGEYEGVAAQEIQEIKDAFKELWEKRGVKDPFPLLTFIVVGKRHHAVFFPERGGGDRTGNCHPGSLIDSGITHPAVHDFYLQSHAAIQGTCRSSHYIILHDDNYNYQLAKIQELAYTLCHVYAKATRTVSIPAPVYYADLVCSRGLFHVDPRANLQFDDSMSNVSGSSNNTLDLNRWISAFKPVNPRLEKSMYFL